MADNALEGLVVRSTAGFVDVELADRVIRCRIRGRLKKVARNTDLCVIGDRVTLERADEETYVVAEVAPRRTRFSRRQPGKGKPKEDVLIANLDQLLITFCYGTPEFNARLLDRFLVIAEHQGVKPVIIMNKSDLEAPGASDWQPLYESLGYRLIRVSAETGEGIGDVQGVLSERISAFVGPSGVGKSSLINRLLPELELDVAPVSQHHGKGRHTTRVASLYAMGNRGFLADTPGIRELGAWALPVDELDECFPELAALKSQCAFRGCSHLHEPDCAVIKAVQEKTIDGGRYESYVRLRQGAGSGSGNP